MAAVLGDNSTGTHGDARWTPGPEGANGRRWVGGWHLRRQHQHRDQDTEEAAASDATLGAPLQQPCMSVGIEASLTCTSVAVNGHDVACAASLGVHGCLCMSHTPGCSMRKVKKMHFVTYIFIHIKVCARLFAFQ